jgi:hypothetical protein
VLVEDSIEKEKPIVAKITPAVKNLITTKGKHATVPEGSPPSIRSARLMK